MSKEVAELAETLRQSEASQTTFAHYIAYHRTTAKDLLAAGYRKPRTITKFKELDALPAGSVAMDADMFPHEKQADGEGGYFWVMTGDAEEHSGIALPATVIWEPQP